MANINPPGGGYRNKKEYKKDAGYRKAVSGPYLRTPAREFKPPAAANQKGGQGRRERHVQFKPRYVESMHHLERKGGK